MSITISAIFALGVLLALLLKYRAVGAGVAVVAVLFGFYLSRTGAADSVDQVMASVVNAVRNIG